MRLYPSGGDGRRRSPIAGGGRCVNLYSEPNGRQPGERPDTMYPRAGFQAIIALPPLAPVTSIYFASNGATFAHCGVQLWSDLNDGNGWRQVNYGYVFTSMDGYNPADLTVGSSRPMAATDVFLTDTTWFTENRRFMIVGGMSGGLVFVDLQNPGTSSGSGFVTYTMNLLYASNISYPTMVDYLDTYFLVVCPGQNIQGDTGFVTSRGPNTFATSLSNTLEFPDLYVATTSGDPFPLVGLKVLERHVYLVGLYRTEIWFNSGDALYPLAELPYVYIEYGTNFPATIATHGSVMMFWGQDHEGGDYIIRIDNNKATDVAGYAVANAMLRYNNRKIFTPPGATSDLASWPAPRAHIEAWGRHAFYVLTFGGQTWAMDMATGLWAQWGQVAAGQGALSQHRINCYTQVAGLALAGDVSNGGIYYVNMEMPDDAGAELTKICGFDPIQSLVNGTGQMVGVDGQLVQFSRFVADIETGLADGQTVVMRYSVDRGRSWGSWLPMTMGDRGQYLVQPMWRLNAVGRDVRFELAWSGPGALNGAFVEATLLTGT